jgi:hypothetical protein
MHSCTNGVMARKITITSKFDNLIIVENGLILKYGKKRERKISFSELEKIYIKTYKLNPLFELVFILSPFLLLLLLVKYLRFEFIILLALFTVIPVFLKVKNYKWCRLKIVLIDDTFFTKKVSMNVKSENITIINKVMKQWFKYNTNAMAPA